MSDTTKTMHIAFIVEAGVMQRLIANEEREITRQALATALGVRVETLAAELAERNEEEDHIGIWEIEAGIKNAPPAPEKPVSPHHFAVKPFSAEVNLEWEGCPSFPVLESFIEYLCEREHYEAYTDIMPSHMQDGGAAGFTVRLDDVQTELIPFQQACERAIDAVLRAKGQ